MPFLDTLSSQWLEFLPILLVCIISYLAVYANILHIEITSKHGATTETVEIRVWLDKQYHNKQQQQALLASGPVSPSNDHKMNIRLHWA